MLYKGLIRLIKEIKYLGFTNALKLSFLDISKKDISIIRNNHTFSCRGKFSDRGVLHQIYINKEYDFGLKNIKTIIDAGANVGYATLFFKEQFPNSKIICIEPDKHNYSQLVHNIKTCKNIHCENKGLRDKDINLYIEDLRGTGSVGFQCRETKSTDGSIKAVSPKTLIKKYNLNQIDIFKIDIEGSEKELFNGDTTWLRKVKYLIIELHERFKIGSSQAFFNAIAPYKYTYKEKGENILIEFHHQNE